MPGTPKSPSHPPVALMVANAIEALKDRKGSSLAAIKKYIDKNYTVQIDRLAPYIKRYVKQATYSGQLVQKSGTGAVGSFKLSKSASSPAKRGKTKTKKKGKKVQITKKPSSSQRPVSPKKKQEKKEKGKNKKSKKQRSKKQKTQKKATPKASKSKGSQKASKKAKKGKKNRK